MNLDELKKNLFRTMQNRCSRYDIDKVTLKQMMLNDNAILIDVRSFQEYNEDHINGAICIPLYEIENKIESRIKNKNTKIICYCSCGIRSKKAVNILKKLGYNNVYNRDVGI